MTQLIDIPFRGGMNEGTDKLMLPSDGANWRLLQNCRLSRDGRLEARPAYTSYASFTSGLRTQLATYKGRMALLSGAYYLTTVAKDELTLDGVSTSPLGKFSAVENLWANPSGAAARQFDLAYAAGILVITQVDDSNVLTITQVCSSDGTQLARTQVTSISSARVIAPDDASVFVIVTRSTAGTMAARTITPGSTTVTAASTLEATVATGTTHFDLSAIPGSTDYLVTYPRVAAGNVRLRRYSSSHVLGFTVDVTPTTAIGDLAVTASSTSQIVWAMTDGNTLKMRTLNGSLVVGTGPTTVSTTAGIRAPGLAFSSGDSSRVWVVATTATASEAYLFSTTNYATITLSDASAPNVWGASKPFVLPNSDGYGAAQVVGQVSAGSAFTLPFYTGCVYEAVFPGNVHGVWDHGICSPLNILSASDTGGRSSVVTDGTYSYALTTFARGLELGGNVPGALRCVRLAKHEQRQCVEAGGVLHISGANVNTFDGAVLSTANFPDVPNAISATQDASGSQTLLATYKYIALYEFTDAQGNVVRSSPSADLTVTLTGGNNRAIVTVNTPRSAKRVGNGITPRVILYRNTPNDSVFYRVAESGDLGIVDQAATTTINDGVSDATAQTREILYTQSQKPVPNVPPGSARFIAAGRDRLIFGGLQDPNQVKLTQLFSPGEPPECAHPANASFTLRLPEPCTGVTAFGDSYIAFSETAIYAVGGAGPQRNGQGEFFSPQKLYADAGCIDWRSIVSFSGGTFFQSNAGLYLLQPGGGAEYVAAVQDTLDAYPVITGAAYCDATQLIAFACWTQDNTNGSGVLLVYDVAAKAWYRDDVSAATLTAFNGRLAYVATFTDAAIITEAAAVGSGGSALPAVTARTGSLRPFGANGFGTLTKVLLPITYQGDSDIELFVSYDDGVNWTSCGAKAVTAAALTVVAGDVRTLEWTPNRAEVDRFALRVDMTNANSNTGGSRLHVITCEVENTGGATRLSATYMS